MSSGAEFDFEDMRAQGKPPPVPPGFGILTVGSREEAEQIARDEPFHTMGWRHNTVMAWTPKFGPLIEVQHRTAAAAYPCRF